MSETVGNQVNTVAAPEGLVLPERIEALDERRAMFIGVMLDKGMVSQETVDSGLFNRFGIDYATGMDSLIHTFAGDREGGVHHLPTLLELGVPGRTVASVVFQDDKVDSRTKQAMSRERQLSKFRTIQKTTSQGSYRCLRVTIKDMDPYTGEIFTHEKLEGSSMFPDKWTTEEVARAIVEVANTEPTKLDIARNSRTHDAKVNGVRIQVVTSGQSSNIITACPVVKTKG